MSLFFVLISHAQYQREHCQNATKELRDQAQVSTDIITDIRENNRMSRIPELFHRIQKIDDTISSLKEIHKNHN